MLSDELKKNSLDYIRPRYIQVSKSDTVKDLKEKIKRVVRDHLEKHLELDNTENIKLEKIKLYSIIYGIKKRKREILKLLYSYYQNEKRYNISGDLIEGDDTTIDVMIKYNNFRI